MGTPPSCPSRAASAHLRVILLFLALALGRPWVRSELQIRNHPLEGDHGWVGDTDRPTVPLGHHVLKRENRDE